MHQPSPATPIDPRIVERARVQVAERRLQSLSAAVDEHASWASEQLPRSRRHDSHLYGRVRRIGESLDLGGGA